MLFLSEQSTPARDRERGAGSLRTLVGLWGDCSLQLQTTPFSLPAPPSPKQPHSPPFYSRPCWRHLQLCLLGQLTSACWLGQHLIHPGLCAAAHSCCPQLSHTSRGLYSVPFPSAAVGFNPWRTEFIGKPMQPPPSWPHVVPNI